MECILGDTLLYGKEWAIVKLNDFLSATISFPVVMTSFLLCWWHVFCELFPSCYVMRIIIIILIIVWVILEHTIILRIDCLLCLNAILWWELLYCESALVYNMECVWTELSSNDLSFTECYSSLSIWIFVGICSICIPCAILENIDRERTIHSRLKCHERTTYRQSIWVRCCCLTRRISCRRDEPSVTRCSIDGPSQCFRLIHSILRAFEPIIIAFKLVDTFSCCCWPAVCQRFVFIWHCISVVVLIWISSPLPSAEGHLYKLILAVVSDILWCIDSWSSIARFNFIRINGCCDSDRNDVWCGGNRCPILFGSSDTIIICCAYSAGRRSIRRRCGICYLCRTLCRCAWIRVPLVCYIYPEVCRCYDFECTCSNIYCIWTTRRLCIELDVWLADCYRSDIRCGSESLWTFLCRCYDTVVEGCAGCARQSRCVPICGCSWYYSATSVWICGVLIPLIRECVSI